VKALAERPGHGVPVNHGGQTEPLPQGAYNVEIAPTLDVGGADDTLRCEIDGAAKADAAAVHAVVLQPHSGDLLDLIKHPDWATASVRGTTAPFDQNLIRE